jgi:hypothetical protein
LKIEAPKGRCNERCVKSHLNKKIKAKRESFTTLRTDCEDLFKLGGIDWGAGKWSLAAVMELGKAEENYADVLKNTFVPGFLSEGAQEMWVMQWEDRSYPHLQSAIGWYEAVLNKSNNADTYTEATGYAAKRLGELKPEEYPSLDEELLNSDYLSVKTSERTYFDKAE